MADRGDTSQRFLDKSNQQSFGAMPRIDDHPSGYGEPEDLSIIDLMSTVKRGLNNRRQTLLNVQQKALAEIKEEVDGPIKKIKTDSRQALSFEPRRYQSVQKSNLRGAVNQMLNASHIETAGQWQQMTTNPRQMDGQVRSMQPLDLTGSLPFRMNASPSGSTAGGGGLQSPFNGAKTQKPFHRKRKTLNEADYSHGAKMMSQRYQVYKKSDHSPVSYRKMSLIQINENVQEHDALGPFCPRGPAAPGQQFKPVFPSFPAISSTSLQAPAPPVPGNYSS